MIKLLLRKGADVNGGAVAAAAAGSDAGNTITPLHRAAIPGYVECAKVLLEHGRAVGGGGTETAAAVDLADAAHGDTPLHCSARYGHRRFSRVLLRYGSMARGLKNRRGETPADVARKHGHSKLLAILSTAV